MIYGEWRRTMPRAELDAHELRQRDLDESWDLRNETLADQLDSWLGLIVRLRAETPIGRATYPRHSRWRAVWRTRDWLVVALLRDTTLLAVVEGSKFELEPALPAKRESLADRTKGLSSAAEFLDYVMNKATAVASEEGR